MSGQDKGILSHIFSCTFFCDLFDISYFIYCFESPLLYRVMMRSRACPPIFHHLPPLWDKFLIGLKFETCHRIIISIIFRNDALLPPFFYDGMDGRGKGTASSFFLAAVGKTPPGRVTMKRPLTHSTGSQDRGGRGGRGPPSRPAGASRPAVGRSGWWREGLSRCSGFIKCCCSRFRNVITFQ